VTRALDIISKEMDVTMALCGRRLLSEVDESILLDNPYKAPKAL
jgi:L-lactate dehydrogenase (cytochrome)